jgi:hypothetical protein
VSGSVTTPCPAKVRQDGAADQPPCAGGRVARSLDIARGRAYQDGALTSLVLLYSGTLFVGAALLFVLQPMVGKMILPLLGGAPAVWSTCMVFFQAALLGGYAYAHATAAWLGVRGQASLHVAALVLASALLPVDVTADLLGVGEASPVPRLLLALATSVGLPFLVVSATAPLLQTWFAHSGHRASRDPYFLYAASNLGSLLALLAYPTVIEPRFHLRGAGATQTVLWTAGYAVLATLTAVCAFIVWRRTSARPAVIVGPGAAADAAAPIGSERARPPARDDATDTLSLGRRLRWIALGFVPSSLFIGATSYVTTDIAAVPLLWVIPLAIYLLTFIVAFGRWSARAQQVVVTVTLPIVLLVIFFMVSGFPQRIWVTVLWHFALLFVAALACHGHLALDRPAARRLTEFYLLVSVGGVLGGVFNALVAPFVFDSLAEYPLVIALGAVLVTVRPSPGSARSAWARDVVPGIGIGVLALILYSSAVTASVDLVALFRVLGLSSGWASGWLGIVQPALQKILVYGPPLVAVHLLRHRAVAMGLALGAVLVVAGLVEAQDPGRVRQARSFFGVLRLSRDEDGRTLDLHHGTTLHGTQSLETERRAEPLSYYHRESPIGQVLAELDGRASELRVAVIGLGAGTLAAYAREGDRITFYEIDRLVRDFATDPSYFTYLGDARDRGAALRIELGDARVRLAAVKAERDRERYDLIVVDAFTSDAIPIHLLTREALRLYLEMLAPDGLVALHISNRHLRLEPVVANLAEDARLTALVQHDDAPETEGAARSTWAVLARTRDALGALADDDRWGRLERDPSVGVWTDDVHDVLSIFKWR